MLVGGSNVFTPSPAVAAVSVASSSSPPPPLLDGSALGPRPLTSATLPHVGRQGERSRAPTESSLGQQTRSDVANKGRIVQKVQFVGRLVDAAAAAACGAGGGGVRGLNFRRRRLGKMASRPKRRAVAEAEAVGNGSGSGSGSDSDSDSGGESDGSGDGSELDLQQEIQVDFEAHTISDGDCNGIKRLLKQLFLKARVNTTELADIIIQQNYVGSVIRQAEIFDENTDEADEGGVFGFITVVNLTEKKGTESVEQIKDFVLSQCKTHHQTAAEQLEKILNDNSKTVNILISERFINVPPQIALPLHKQLQTELVDAQKTGKSCGKCHYYLIISKACVEVGKKKPNQKGKPKEDLRFANAEDEFFYEQSTLKFSYSVENECDSCLSGRWSFDDVPMKPLRVVMLIPADRLNAVMDKLKEYLSV